MDAQSLSNLMIEKYKPIIESDGVERPRCLSRTVRSPTRAAATMTIDRYDRSRIFRMHVLNFILVVLQLTGGRFSLSLLLPGRAVISNTSLALRTAHQPYLGLHTDHVPYQAHRM